MTGDIGNRKISREIEILAPAGSYDCFRAAVCAGADAVYAGGPRFGARAYADNFSEEELRQAVREAHLHGCRFYLTVNTLLKDEEMLGTAEEFLQNSLNVSDTSRNLFMHRNTLMYRLDKLERMTGLNLRKFSDAVTFRVITILNRLV